MTKGHLIHLEENLNSEKASYLAAGFAINDFALKYGISLRMAEQLVLNNLTVGPVSPKSREDLEARVAWSKAVDRHRHRENPDEVKDMEVEGHREMPDESSDARESLFPKREEVFNPLESSSGVGHSEFPPFVQRTTLKATPAFAFPITSSPGVSNDRMQRHPNLPALWPYYAVAYPPHVTPIRMFNRGYPVPHPTANYDSQSLFNGVCDMPIKRHRKEYVQPMGSSVVRPSEKRNGQTIEDKNRPLVKSEGRTLFKARRNEENDHLTSEETSVQIKEKTGALNHKDIFLTNSCRPSVLVMQRSPSNSHKSSTCEETIKIPEQTTESVNDHNETKSEQYTMNDDHESTDSDSSNTPPNSPCSSHSVASSDEHFSSDSPRSWDSSKEKPHKCPICGRAFRKHSALIIHHRVHSGEKPYKCPECAKQFSISGNLRRHFLIHTGERPYICPECSRAFNNPSHLTRHIRKLHKKTNTE